MRGQPDWGAMRPLGVMATMADVGELAARLGSRCVYDRRGNVYYWDDFEGTVNRFRTNTTGVGVAPILNSAYSLSGSQCVHLDSVGIGRSEMLVWAGVLNSKSLGVEIAFGLTGFLDFFDVYFTYNAAATRLRGLVRIRMNPITGNSYDVQIMLPGLVFQDIVTDVAIPTPDYGWGHLKLVCDFDSGYYNRLLFDAGEYDLSQYLLPGSPFPRTEKVTVVISAEGTTGLGGIEAWVEDLLLTCQEP